MPSSSWKRRSISVSRSRAFCCSRRMRSSCFFPCSSAMQGLCCHCWIRWGRISYIRLWIKMSNDECSLLLKSQKHKNFPFMILIIVDEKKICGNTIHGTHDHRLKKKVKILMPSSTTALFVLSRQLEYCFYPNKNTLRYQRFLLCSQFHATVLRAVFGVGSCCLHTARTQTLAVPSGVTQISLLTVSTSVFVLLLLFVATGLLLNSWNKKHA